ncbi:hypothetical protein SHKM778_69650 [Streptomyces sp. KM77-8]|uniref:Uncharacterized protein n=1 Tax=Streptomyces haneummycinicus TaxID=3074435 RepID=A0AAT9HT94_9ACTN
MLVGPLAFLVLAGVVVIFDPLMVAGGTPRSPPSTSPASPRAHRPTTPRPLPDADPRAGGTPPRTAQRR